MTATATAVLLPETPSPTGAANDNAAVPGGVAWYRNYHRYYDPAIGRYTQPDPFLIDTARFVGPSGAVESATTVSPPTDPPYSYVANEPLTRMDPTGERWIKKGREGRECFMAAVSDSSCGCGKKRRVLACRWRVCSGWMWEQEGSGNLWDNQCYGTRWWGGPDSSEPGTWQDDYTVMRRFDCVTPPKDGGPVPMPLDFNGPRAYATSG